MYKFLFLFLLCSCSQISRQSKPEYVYNMDSIIDEFHLLGKKVNSLDSILLGKDKNTNLFLLYNFYDCGSCVDSAFQLVKKIDAFYGVKKVAIISSLGGTAQFQARNEYYEYVYSDEADLLRRELKYVQTPILIKIDSLKTVVDYLLPNVSEEREYARFLRFMRQ